jgi:hypothetical protein
MSRIAIFCFCFLQLSIFSVSAESYQNLRFEEDWSCCDECHYFAPIKYVEFEPSYPIWASFGGQIRLRGEGWKHYDFNRDNDDSYLLTRVRLHADIHYAEYARVFVEGKAALMTGDREDSGGRRSQEIDVLSLQNAFLEVGLPFGEWEAKMRAGRQELIMGKERLLSPFDWSNSRRTFDALVLILDDCCCWKITSFYSTAVRIKKYEYNTGSGDHLFGVYAEGKPGFLQNLDVYVLGQRRKKATYNTIADVKERRYTIGARIGGNVDYTPWDYEIEGAFQWGEHGSGDVSASMLSAELGYLIPLECWEPRAHFNLDYASGDEHRTDVDIETFSQLFPNSHCHLGYIDTIGRQNIFALSTGVAACPCDQLFIETQYHWFWRADRSDALYNGAGRIIRPANASTRVYVGSELDLLVKYCFSPEWMAFAGYSHFFPGAFLDRSATPHQDIDFTYLGLQFTF